MNFKEVAASEAINKVNPHRHNPFVRQHRVNPVVCPNCPDDCNRQESPGKPEEFAEFHDFTHDTFPNCGKNKNLTR